VPLHPARRLGQLLNRNSETEIGRRLAQRIGINLPQAGLAFRSFQLRVFAEVRMNSPVGNIPFIQAGYEDVNDAERLAQDLIFRLMGSERIWERGAALTSRLLSFETELLSQEGNLAGLASINRELIAKAETIHSPQRVVLAKVEFQPHTVCRDERHRLD
jgi:hypothetical protein